MLLLSEEMIDFDGRPRLDLGVCLTFGSWSRILTGVSITCLPMVVLTILIAIEKNQLFKV